MTTDDSEEHADPLPALQYLQQQEEERLRIRAKLLGNDDEKSQKPNKNKSKSSRTSSRRVGSFMRGHADVGTQNEDETCGNTPEQSTSTPMSVVSNRTNGSTTDQDSGISADRPRPIGVFTRKMSRRKVQTDESDTPKKTGKLPESIAIPSTPVRTPTSPVDDDSRSVRMEAYSKALFSQCSPHSILDDSKPPSPLPPRDWASLALQKANESKNRSGPLIQQIVSAASTPQRTKSGTMLEIAAAAALPPRPHVGNSSSHQRRSTDMDGVEPAVSSGASVRSRLPPRSPPRRSVSRTKSSAGQDDASMCCDPVSTESPPSTSKDSNKISSGSSVSESSRRRRSQHQQPEDGSVARSRRRGSSRKHRSKVANSDEASIGGQSRISAECSTVVSARQATTDYRSYCGSSLRSGSSYYKTPDSARRGRVGRHQSARKATPVKHGSSEANSLPPTLPNLTT